MSVYFVKCKFSFLATFGNDSNTIFKKWAMASNVLPILYACEDRDLPTIVFGYVNFFVPDSFVSYGHEFEPQYR